MSLKEFSVLALVIIHVISMGSCMKPVEEMSKYQYPHHINISWEMAPATSQSINWRTSELQKESYVEYLEAESTPFFEDRIISIKAESEY